MFACTDEHAAKMKLVISKAERYVYVTNLVMNKPDLTISDAMETRELFKELEEALKSYHKPSETLHGNKD